MPVRSTSSSVLVWPDKAAVDRAVRRWAQVESRKHADLVRLGYFGSYARGDWGVGSDLDVVAVVAGSAQPFDLRALDWDVSGLPVPVDLLVYTLKEWQAMQDEGTRFARLLAAESVWIFPEAEGGTS